ncbi:MAG: hypothetical protein O7C55_01040 [Rickettsia endosymbiont of Ixodes persulcatus]|nr:hypothetical protein [Rickettsia endosymbiont of Ixodes persulcatus]
MKLLVIAISCKADKPKGWIRGFVPSDKSVWGEINGLKFDKNKFKDIFTDTGLYEIESKSTGGFGDGYVQYEVTKADFLKSMVDLTSVDTVVTSPF